MHTAAHDLLAVHKNNRPPPTYCCTVLLYHGCVQTDTGIAVLCGVHSNVVDTNGVAQTALTYLHKYNLRTHNKPQAPPHVVMNRNIVAVCLIDESEMCISCIKVGTRFSRYTPRGTAGSYHAVLAAPCCCF